MHFLIWFNGTHDIDIEQQDKFERCSRCTHHWSSCPLCCWSLARKQSKYQAILQHMHTEVLRAWSKVLYTHTHASIHAHTHIHTLAFSVSWPLRCISNTLKLHRKISLVPSLLVRQASLTPLMAIASGLLLDHKWAKAIVSGQKCWELRSIACRKRGRIGIVATARTSPTGKPLLLGEATITGADEQQD